MTSNFFSFYFWTKNKKLCSQTNGGCSQFKLESNYKTSISVAEKQQLAYFSHQKCFLPVCCVWKSVLNWLHSMSDHLSSSVSPSWVSVPQLWSPQPSYTDVVYPWRQRLVSIPDTIQGCAVGGEISRPRPITARFRENSRRVTHYGIPLTRMKRRTASLSTGHTHASTCARTHTPTAKEREKYRERDREK